MSAADKAKDKAQAAKGKVKKGPGKALDNPHMEAEGKADQVKGNLAVGCLVRKQAGAQRSKGRLPAPFPLRLKGLVLG